MGTVPREGERSGRAYLTQRPSLYRSFPPMGLTPSAPSIDVTTAHGCEGDSGKRASCGSDFCRTVTIPDPTEDEDNEYSSVSNYPEVVMNLITGKFRDDDHDMATFGSRWEEEVFSGRGLVPAYRGAPPRIVIKFNDTGKKAYMTVVGPNFEAKAAMTLASALSEDPMFTTNWHVLSTASPADRRKMVTEIMHVF